MLHYIQLTVRAEHLARFEYLITNRTRGSATLQLYIYNSNANNVSAGTVRVYVLWQKVA